jgi:hypothetical protein
MWTTIPRGALTPSLPSRRAASAVQRFTPSSAVAPLEIPAAPISIAALLP